MTVNNSGTGGGNNSTYADRARVFTCRTGTTLPRSFSAGIPPQPNSNSNTSAPTPTGTTTTPPGPTATSMNDNNNFQPDINGLLRSLPALTRSEALAEKLVFGLLDVITNAVTGPQQSLGCVSTPDADQAMKLCSSAADFAQTLVHIIDGQNTTGTVTPTQPHTEAIPTATPAKPEVETPRVPVPIASDNKQAEQQQKNKNVVEYEVLHSVDHNAATSNEWHQKQIEKALKYATVVANLNPEGKFNREPKDCTDTTVNYTTASMNIANDLKHARTTLSWLVTPKHEFSWDDKLVLTMCEFSVCRIARSSGARLPSDCKQVSKAYVQNEDFYVNELSKEKNSGACLSLDFQLPPAVLHKVMHMMKKSATSETEAFEIVLNFKLATEKHSSWLEATGKAYTPLKAVVHLGYHTNRDKSLKRLLKREAKSYKHSKTASESSESDTDSSSSSSSESDFHAGKAKHRSTRRLERKEKRLKRRLAKLQKRVRKVENKLMKVSLRNERLSYFRKDNGPDATRT